MSYDLSRKRNPDKYKSVSDEDYLMSNRRDLRDKRGLTPKDKSERGSYAEVRL